MKILFVWTGVTSYMADCWRELQRLSGVELKIVVERVASGKEFDAARVLHGLDYTLVDPDAPRPSQPSRPLAPDVVFAVGWHSKVVRELVTCAAWRNVPKVCCFDLPWRWRLRCLAARFVLRPFLRHYDVAYVPGRACERYAKWLGFKKIFQGLFSIDVGRFEPGEGIAPNERTGFVYIGRFAPEKRLDVLLAAYARYREQGGTWSLDLYGAGPLESKLVQAIKRLGVSTAVLHPFAQPDAVPSIYRSHACLVLTSAFDPWPLVALEAKASGCEVIQSDRCGNRFELATHVVRFGDAEALARTMLDVERREAVSPALPLTKYDCGTWARRTLEIAEVLNRE